MPRAFVLINSEIGTEDKLREKLKNVEKVREDVRDELVSVQSARDVYGVVIKPETTGQDPWTIEVDYKATEELRKKLKVKKGDEEKAS